MIPLVIAGPPGSGKTSLLLRLLPRLAQDGPVRYVKVDCLATRDHELVSERLGLPAQALLADPACPDHALAEALAGWLRAAWSDGTAWLVIETAGLCDRCTAFLEGAPSVQVIDLLKNVHAAAKMRVPLRAADLVVLTKGSLVSPAERELVAALVTRLNPAARVLPFDGLTGEGLERVVAMLKGAPTFAPRPVVALRQALPNGRCDVCQQGLAG
jgi:Ni2+-binding GTPase involved in maturation of urease and hydrogenase